MAKSDWPDAAIMGRVRDWVLPAPDVESGCYWIIDDTGFPKKGKHSVGVARQYCGQLGKQDNCQVAVSLSLASARGSMPIAYQLYLPKDWAADPVRRKTAGVPADIVFATKPEIALAQLRQAVAAGVLMGVVLADAGYGDETAFRDGITELGMPYAVGIRPATTVWAPGTAPLPPKPWSGRGVRPTRLRREPGHEPVAVKTLAMALPQEAYRTLTWRGFHHHATLCIAAYGFLVSERLSHGGSKKKLRSTTNAFLTPKLCPSRPPDGRSGMCLTRFQPCVSSSHKQLPAGFNAVLAAVEVVVGNDKVRLAAASSPKTDKADPKDADLLLTIADDLDLTALASASRKRLGAAQTKNKGADVFLANPSGEYIGRVCLWKTCAPGIRMACDARHCGRRHYLHDDLGAVKLSRQLIAEPPIEVWPRVIARTPVPTDILPYLAKPQAESG